MLYIFDCLLIFIDWIINWIELDDYVVSFWELVIELMNVSVYYKWQMILLDNIAAIIF